MADIFSKEKRSFVMGQIRSKNTKPEIFARKFLFSKGFRFRLHNKKLPGNPDLVLSKYKTIIFVHGCFWHGHSCKIGSGNRLPKTNSSYWAEKFSKNKKRDKKNKRKLILLGWKVITLWECQTKSVEKLNQGLKLLLDLKQNG